MSYPMIFFGVFVGQIFLISYFLPEKVLKRVNFVLDTYPPEEYPKLYPRSPDVYRMLCTAFRFMNRFIFLFGFGILYAIYRLDPMEDGGISEAWPAAYGMVQFIPYMLLELVGFQGLKWMRDANPSSKRHAELRPRRVSDYISSGLIALTIGMVIGTCLFDFYLHRSDLQWERPLVLVVTNLFMFSVAAFSLYGRKPDPHQDREDRARQIAAQLRSLCYVSLVVSAFFMFQAVDDIYDMDFLDAPLLSLYFQVIILLSVGINLRSMRLEDINFDVYKEEPAAD